MECKIILVVEDDTCIREALRVLLEHEGYKVVTAVNGKEALDVLQTLDHPCLVLLDWHMPVMDGAEFLAIMKQDDVLSRIPVCVVSAMVDMAKKENPDVHGYICKPFEIEALLKAVHLYCGKP